MKMTRTKALAIVGIVVLSTPALAFAALNIVASTNLTFTVGADLTVTNVEVSPGAGYSTTMTPCTKGTFPSWGCSDSTFSTLLPGNSFTIGIEASTSLSTISPKVNVTEGSFSDFTTATSFYPNCPGLTSSSIFPNSIQSGLPAPMTANSNYCIWTVVTINQNAPPATAITFSFSFGF